MNSQTAMKLQKPLEEYIRYFETLTPRSVRLIEKIADPTMRFIDPFNDVHGIDAVEAVLEKKCRGVINPKYRITDYAWGRDGHTVYLRWSFSFEEQGALRLITGMSEVSFSPLGKVACHVDYWDTGSQLMAYRPFAGWVWRNIRRRLGV